MDTSQEFTHVSLCAGYGGIDLGLKRAIPSLRTVAFSEIEAYACANLVAKMEAGQLDPAPIWTDLKTFPWEAFHERVDILSGGYPCQPFSAAGKRLGTDDPRHLWPFIAAGIRLMQPRFCFFENVEGHISLGLRAVIEELAELGYTATWGIFSAAEVGLGCDRKRVFILAYSGCPRGEAGLPRQELWHEGFSKEPDDCCHRELIYRPGQGEGPEEPPRLKCEVGGIIDGAPAPLGYGDDISSYIVDDCCGCHDDVAELREAIEAVHDEDSRADELRLIGNGVVPAVAYLAFTTLYKELNP